MTEQGKKISVIIPAYNAGKYLGEALDSVLAQTYENWEVILVVTMSEDKTEKVAGEYQRKDSRIRCLDNEGKGISSARNKGLSAAEGEYLLFMDADDYLPDPCVLQRYLNIAEKISSDIIVSNYARLWKERFLPAETHQNFSVCHRNSEEFRFRGFFSVGTLSYVWGKLYRRSFLVEKVFSSRIFPMRRTSFSICSAMSVAQSTRLLRRSGMFTGEMSLLFPISIIPIPATAGWESPGS